MINKGDRSHIEQRTNHRGRTDRHTRRSAVLTIICGGRAVGAGCIVITTTTTREKGQSSCKEPHINQETTFGHKGYEVPIKNPRRRVKRLAETGKITDF